jgi:thioredoxin 1
MNKVIKFSATWCGPCKMMKPQYNKFIETAAIDGKNIEIIDLDVDTNHEEAEKYGVRSIPITFFIKDGEVADKLSGVISYDKLLDTYHTVYNV